MGKRVSLASLAADPVEDAPGVDNSPAAGQPLTSARWVPTARCLPNPRNPRDELGDLSDLASIKERQLQSCLAITPEAYLALWEEDRDRLNAGPDDVVIINGNRRVAAAHAYGQARLMVVIDDGIASSKASVLRAAFDENMSRKDFDPIEEAKAVILVVAEYATAKEAAEREGWSQAWISHRKNLLKLHPDLQQQVRAKARGEEGLSIHAARRLGSVRGIETMTLADQSQALAELLRSDAEASAIKKGARREVRREAAIKEPPADVSPTVPPGASLSTSGEFSAENSDAPPVPEQRVPPAVSVKDEVGATADAAPDGHWYMPEEGVLHFSDIFIDQAAATGTTPDSTMWEALKILQAHYREASATQ
ncbi:hypothetical protein QMK19_33790 [Streptomyces sp. H10-C2]|uniref:ParB/RepB/Spo0J family partition protein n=1 Tax=unclassified Streptomyces TaxID=2593676 RepID=UPI0024B9F7DA|nr:MULTISPECIES: hypothetical protein [unclassified Streptomyces]MDJ0345520.1 hypothetical protein [Streptomyces sp. PH10-H1]MDJ0374466.1 hypothetical protein [Streptomyces sp. H10-C2]